MSTAPSTPRPVESAAEEMMRRETRVSYGPAPHTLSEEPLAELNWQMHGDEFLLRGEGEHYFHYRKGDGVTVERGANVDSSEESLWLNGSVYAAVASINGLLPVHASAVAHDGLVYAFAGPAGAGKSTLAAALARFGLPLFCDDTLVLDLSEPDQITCLPGHKRLKLTPESVKLTGARRQEKVSATVNKFYAVPAMGPVGEALPLSELIFLERGAEPMVLPIEGAERLIRMQDDHHTAHLFASARGFNRFEQFGHLVRLARQIRMARFIRPADRACFNEGIALVAHYVSNRDRD